MFLKKVVFWFILSHKIKHKFEKIYLNSITKLKICKATLNMLLMKKKNDTKIFDFMINFLYLIETL